MQAYVDGAVDDDAGRGVGVVDGACEAGGGDAVDGTWRDDGGEPYWVAASRKLDGVLYRS